jgi:hypothetical protein
MKAASIFLSSVLAGTSLLSLGLSHRVLAQADPMSPTAPAGMPSTPADAPTGGGAPSSPADAPTGGTPSTPSDSPASSPSAPTEAPASDPTAPASDPTAPASDPTTSTPSDTPSASSESPDAKKSVLALCGPGGASLIVESDSLPIGCRLAPTDAVPAAGQV